MQETGTLFITFYTLNSILLAIKIVTQRRQHSTRVKLSIIHKIFNSSNRKWEMEVVHMQICHAEEF